MKDFFHIILTGVATGLIAFIGFLPTVHAETVITDGFLQGDTTWSKEHSPYILSDAVTVSSGMTLTIEPGVEVRVDPAAEYDPYMYVAGSIVIRGSPQELVRIGNIWGITIDHGYADIAHAVFNMKGNLMFSGAQGRISSTTISNKVGEVVSDGVYIENSKIDVGGSTIEDNANGVVIQDSGGVFQVRKPGIIQRIAGLIGLIHRVEAATQSPSQVSITGSRLIHNIQTSIDNRTAVTVGADHNWWGSADGPRTIPANLSSHLVTSEMTNGLKGQVTYDPWLDHDPFDTEAARCCSNILFLPGLEASRLYRDEPSVFVLGTSTNRLWEPNRNNDVRKLFLNTDGSSIDPTVYAGGPISKALGVKDIYGSFMDFLDGLVQKGAVNEWRPFGYDWREPIQDVVNTDTVRATTTESLINTVQELASRSKTGKVTLVAHSNGGLVAKYLVKTLAGMGKEGLIDSVISVAVPYLGTPQAILGLLHGDNQSIFGGLLLKKTVAKELGMNMSSTYSLIPSAAYFTKVFEPTIAYASATSVPAVTSAARQDSFINSRANAALMNAAEILHGILDPFSWPASIARWAIVGWGNKTAKGIVYSGPNNSKYTATTTSMGDGTVVAPSAAYNAGTTTSLDLTTISAAERRGIDHANILSASATQKAVEDVVTEDSHQANARTIEEELALIPGVSIGEPDYTKEATFLVVSTHSPVDLHLYDAYGNHTGVAPLPLGIDEDIEEGLYTNIEKNIPGSSVEMYGDEDQPETYISVPDDSGQTYTVGIEGTGVGEFTYTVQRIRGGEVLDSVSYASLPVTPLMTASTSVTTQQGGVTHPITLASSTPALNIDVDGNGSADIIVKANAPQDPVLFLESLKKTIIAFIGSTKRSQDFVKRIDHLEELVTKGKFKKLRDTTDKLKKSIVHKKPRLLSVAEKDQIISQIDLFLAQFE